MSDWEQLTVTTSYKGEQYAIDLYRHDLAVEGMPAMRHFAIQKDWTGQEAVFELGRLVLRDELASLVRRGDITREQADEITGVAEAREHLPLRSRRIDRKDAVQWMYGSDEFLLVDPEEAGSRYAERFRQAYDSARKGEHQRLDMAPLDVLRHSLEHAVRDHIKEADCFWIAPVDEIMERRQLVATISGLDDSDAASAEARSRLAALDVRLDGYYESFYAHRRTVACGGLSSDEIASTVDNLRKNRRHPEARALVRALIGDAEDAGLYRPYAWGMDLARRTLEDLGELSEESDRALFLFMHRPHEVLDGIVPALHALGYAFMRSPFLLGALASSPLKKRVFGTAV